MRATGANKVRGSGKSMRRQMDMLTHLASCNVLLSIFVLPSCSCCLFQADSHSLPLLPTEQTLQRMSFLKCHDGKCPFKLNQQQKEMQPHDLVYGTYPLNLSTLHLQQPVICMNSKSQQAELILLIKVAIQVFAEVVTQ